MGKINDFMKIFANDFGSFIYEQKIIGFLIGTFAGLASSNLIASFKKNVLDYILTKIFKLGNLNSLFFITSIIEYSLMLSILYFIIKLTKPYFDRREAASRDAEIEYADELLSTLKKIDKKLDAPI